MDTPPQVPQWTFGDRLRKARRHARLSQAELAQAIGVRHSTVATWEAGQKHPQDVVETAQKIAAVTNVPVDWLLLGKVPTEDTPRDGGTTQRSANPRVVMPPFRSVTNRTGARSSAGWWPRNAGFVPATSC